MPADPPTTLESTNTAFAVLANRTTPKAIRHRVTAKTGKDGQGPQSIGAAEALVGQGQAALGGGNLVLAQLRAKQALQQISEYMPALLLLRQVLQT
ncbi:MAG: hypothetical protein ACREHV_06005, partial [Rhizomicrobium sp.]